MSRILCQFVFKLFFANKIVVYVKSTCQQSINSSLITTTQKSNSALPHCYLKNCNLDYSYNDNELKINQFLAILISYKFNITENIFAEKIDI
jgi:hypothetical protein